MSTPFTVQVIDLRTPPNTSGSSERAVPAWMARNRFRHAMAGVAPGQAVRLQIDRQSLITDVLGLVPEGVRVQIEADDIFTLRRWSEALGVIS